jgi:hypothetical protein
VLVTEKDAVKLMPLAAAIEQAGGEPGPRLLAVPLQVEPEQAFFEALDTRLRAWRAHPLPSPHGHTTS